MIIEDKNMEPVANSAALESVATDIFLAMKNDGLAAEDAALKLQGYEKEEITIIEKIIEGLLNDAEETNKSNSKEEATDERSGTGTEACDPEVPETCGTEEKGTEA